MLANTSNKRYWRTYTPIAVAIVIVVAFFCSPYILVHSYGNGFKIVSINTEYLNNNEEPVYLYFNFYRLKNLKELKIYCNKNTNLKYLEKMHSLEKLTLTLIDCEGNYNSVLLNKMPYMKSVKDLTIVSFDGKAITESAKWVYNFPALEKLCIISHELIDISGIQKFEKLKNLTISDINVGVLGTFDLNVLKKNKNLEELTVSTSSTNVPDTKGLSDLSSLVSLSIFSNNPQYDMNNIEKMTSLRNLKINYCGEKQDELVIVLDQRTVKFIQGLENFEYFHFQIIEAE